MSRGRMWADDDRPSCGSTVALPKPSDGCELGYSPRALAVCFSWLGLGLAGLLACLLIRLFNPRVPVMQCTIRAPAAALDMALLTPFMIARLFGQMAPIHSPSTTRAATPACTLSPICAVRQCGYTETQVGNCTPVYRTPAKPASQMRCIWHVSTQPSLSGCVVSKHHFVRGLRSRAVASRCSVLNHDAICQPTSSLPGAKAIGTIDHGVRGWGRLRAPALEGTSSFPQFPCQPGYQNEVLYVRANPPRLPPLGCDSEREGLDEPGWLTGHPPSSPELAVVGRHVPHCFTSIRTILLRSRL